MAQPRKAKKKKARSKTPAKAGDNDQEVILGADERADSVQQATDTDGVIIHDEMSDDEIAKVIENTNLPELPVMTAEPEVDVRQEPYAPLTPDTDDDSIQSGVMAAEPVVAIRPSQPSFSDLPALTEDSQPTQEPVALGYHPGIATIPEPDGEAPANGSVLEQIASLESAASPGDQDLQSGKRGKRATWTGIPQPPLPIDDDTDEAPSGPRYQTDEGWPIVDTPGHEGGPEMTTPSTADASPKKTLIGIKTQDIASLLGEENAQEPMAAEATPYVPEASEDLRATIPDGYDSGSDVVVATERSASPDDFEHILTDPATPEAKWQRSTFDVDHTMPGPEQLGLSSAEEPESRDSDDDADLPPVPEQDYARNYFGPNATTLPRVRITGESLRPIDGRLSEEERNQPVAAFYDSRVPEIGVHDPSATTLKDGLVKADDLVIHDDSGEEVEEPSPVVDAYPLEDLRNELGTGDYTLAAESARLAEEEAQQYSAQQYEEAPLVTDGQAPSALQAAVQQAAATDSPAPAEAQGFGYVDPETAIQDELAKYSAGDADSDNEPTAVRANPLMQFELGDGPDEDQPAVGGNAEDARAILTDKAEQIQGALTGAKPGDDYAPEKHFTPVEEEFFDSGKFPQPAAVRRGPEEEFHDVLASETPVEPRWTPEAVAAYEAQQLAAQLQAQKDSVEGRAQFDALDNAFFDKDPRRGKVQEVGGGLVPTPESAASRPSSAYDNWTMKPGDAAPKIIEPEAAGQADAYERKPTPMERLNEELGSTLPPVSELGTVKGEVQTPSPVRKATGVQRPALAPLPAAAAVVATDVADNYTQASTFSDEEMISIITETSPGLEDPEFSEEITEEELEKRVGSAPFIADSDKPLAYDEYADDKSIGISNSDGQNLPASTYEGHSRRKKALGWVGTVAALIGIAGSAILGYAGKKELKSEKPKKALDKSYLATPPAHEIVVDAGVSRDWKKIDPKGLLDAKVGTVPFTPAPVYDAGVPDASQSASVPQHDAAVPAPDASRAVSQPDASQAYVPPVAVRGPDASVPQHDAAPQAPDASAPQQDASVYIPPVQDASVPPADAAVKTAPPKVKTPVPDTKVPKVKAPKAPSIDGYCEFQQPKRYDSTAPNDFFGADSDTLLEQYVADMIRLAQKRGKTSITFYAHGGADPDAADGWDTAKTYNSKTLPWKRAQDGKRKVEKMAKKYAKGTGVQVTVHARSAGMLDLVHPDAEQVAYINKTTGAQRKAGTFGKWIDKAKGAYDKIFKRAARGRLLLVSTQDLSGMDHTQLEDRVKENPANKAYGPGCTDASSSTGSLDRSVPASYGPAKTKKTPVDRQDAPSQSLAYDVTTSDSAPMGPGLAAASLLADDVVSTMDFGGFPKDGQRSYGCASQSTPNDSTNAGIPIGIALAGLGLVALRHRKKDAPRPDYTAGNVDEDAPVPAMADVEGYADDYSIGRAVVGVTDRMVLSRPAPVMIQGIPAPTEYGGIADIDDHYESFEVSEYVEDLTDELEELVVRTEQDERRTMTASGVIDTGSSKDDYVLTDEAVNAEFDAFIRELDEADQPEVEYSLKNLPNLSVRKIAKADRITFNDLKGPKVKTKMYTFGQMSRIEELNEVKDCLSELGIDTSTTRYRFAEDEGTVEEALAMVREAVKESAAAARRPQPTVPATYYSLSDLDPSLAVDELNDVKRSLEAIGVKTDMPYRFAADTGSLDEVYEMLGMDPVKIRQRQEMYDPLKDEFPDMDRKAAKVYSSLQKINQEYRRTKELSEARRLTEEVEYERLTVEAEKAAPDCMDIPEPAVAYRDVVSGVIENAR